MTQSDKQRLLDLVANAVEPLEKAAAYDSVALAERDEPDEKTRQLLHDAALEIMRGNLDTAQAHLQAITAH